MGLSRIAAIGMLLLLAPSGSWAAPGKPTPPRGVGRCIPDALERTLDDFDASDEYTQIVDLDDFTAKGKTGAADVTQKKKPEAPATNVAKGKYLEVRKPGYNEHALLFDELTDDTVVVTPPPAPPPKKPPTAAHDAAEEAWDEKTQFRNTQPVIHPKSKSGPQAAQATDLLDGARDNLHLALGKTADVHGVGELTLEARKSAISELEKGLEPFRKTARETPTLLTPKDLELMREAVVRIDVLAGGDVRGTVNGALAPVGKIKTTRVELPSDFHAVTDTRSPLKQEGPFEFADKDPNAMGSIGLGAPGHMGDSGEIVGATPPFEAAPNLHETGMHQPYKAPPPHTVTHIEIPDASTKLDQWMAHGMRPGESATLYAQGGNSILVLYHPHLPPEIAALARANANDPDVINWAIAHRTRTVRKIWKPGATSEEWIAFARRDHVMSDFSIQAEARFSANGEPVYETLRPKNPDAVEALEQEVEFVMGATGQSLAIDTALALDMTAPQDIRKAAWDRILASTGMKPTQFKYKLGNLDATYRRTEDAAIRQARINRVAPVGNVGRGFNNPHQKILMLDPRDKGWGRNAIWSRSKGRWVIFDH